VFQHGPHAPGAGDTTQVEVRFVFLMDPNHAVDAVAGRPDSVWTLLAFCNKFIQPDATSGNCWLMNTKDTVSEFTRKLWLLSTGLI
jgi:hypothetical protein